MSPARERVGYLARLHGETGRFDAAEALALARVEYAAFIGFQQLDLGLSPDELHDSYRVFLGLLTSRRVTPSFRGKPQA